MSRSQGGPEQLESIRELLLERLASSGVDDIRPCPQGYRGSCPHCGGDDRFLFGERRDGDGYYLKCYAGCKQPDLLLVLELSWMDLRLSTGTSKSHVVELRNPDLARARAIRWAWRQRVPLGKPALNVGNEGVGKGAVTAYLCARWSRGELHGDLFGRPAHVIVVGDEDAVDDTWTPRLHLADADFAYVHFQVEEDGDIDFTEPGDVEHLRALIRKVGARVVIFDALLDHIGGTGVDEFKPKAVRGALRPLRRLAAEEDVAVVGTLHPRKGRALTYRELVANSHQFNAVSRSSLLLAEHPEDRERRVLAWGKGNHAGLVPTLEFRIEAVTFELPSGKQTTDVRAVDWKETEVTIDQALRASTGTSERERRFNDRRERVFEALTDEPQSERAIAATSEVPRTTVQRILQELEEQEEAIQTDAGWRLKPVAPGDDETLETDQGDAHQEPLGGPAHSGQSSGPGHPEASLRAHARKAEGGPAHKITKSGPGHPEPAPAVERAVEPPSEPAENGVVSDAERLLAYLQSLERGES